MNSRIKQMFIILAAVFFLAACGDRKHEDFSYLKNIIRPSFDDCHAQTGDNNEYLILGNIPVTEPADTIPEDLAGLIGRWEGYDFSPPVKKDLKIVTVITEITDQYITAKHWASSNLQIPGEYQEIRANIIKKKPLTFQVDSCLFGQFPKPCTMKIVYDKRKEMLNGEIRIISGEDFPWPMNTDASRFSLTRNKNFKIYRDYDKYLSSRSIHAIEYENKDLAGFGKGYMLYFPKEYETRKDWPLIVFLHGSGDVGSTIQILAKASPYMYIRNQGDLPFVIASPLLGSISGSRSFPVEYLDEFLDMITKKYAVDPDKVYFTGLSMGGEAVLRYAAYHPEKLSAVAALCAPLNVDGTVEHFEWEGWERIDGHINGLKDFPVLYIHGSDDPLVVPENAEKVISAVKNAGAKIEVRKLKNHDHDVWTDTYSDREFYNWFLGY